MVNDEKRAFRRVVLASYPKLLVVTGLWNLLAIGIVLTNEGAALCFVLWGCLSLIACIVIWLTCSAEPWSFDNNRPADMPTRFRAILLIVLQIAVFVGTLMYYC